MPDGLKRPKPIEPMNSMGFEIPAVFRKRGGQENIMMEYSQIHEGRQASEMMRSSLYVNSDGIIKEAAALIAVRPSTLRAWVLHREIPFVRVGRLVRFKRSDLLALIERNSVPVEKSQ